MDVVAGVERLRREADTLKRNALALELAGTGRKEVLEALLELIDRPDLKDFRGTLVHGLKYFDCSPLLGLLVDLQINGNWEVAHEAHGLLSGIQEVSGEKADSAFRVLTIALSDASLEGWRRLLIQETLEMFE